MPQNISKFDELLVISDTGMFRRNKEEYAFGPVVKEFEALDCFKSITWIGFNSPDQVNNNAYLKITKQSIRIQSLKKTGGKRVLDKIFILIQYPIYFFTILKAVNKAKYIHVRAPSNPAVIAIFISFFFPKKQFWFKYAGDWVGKAAPFYKFQRMCLKKLNTNAKVTINGKWPKQTRHCLTFENPCLDDFDRKKGKLCISDKKLEATINYCFVGGLNENKGCLILLQALNEINLNHKSIALHIVGDGHLKTVLEELASKLEISVKFYGAIPKDEVTKIYEICHFIVLPSQSEGFPKVIGEGMNYGCVPIVSNVSCIGQYIEHSKNGFLIETISVSNVKECLLLSLKLKNEDYKNIIKYNYGQAKKFTYSNYRNRISQEIFN